MSISPYFHHQTFKTEQDLLKDLGYGINNDTLKVTVEGLIDPLVLNAADYVTLNLDGFDGSGSAYANFDADAFSEAVAARWAELYPDRPEDGYLRGDDKWTREMLREKLRELKTQGMESLVIDLRENGGGMHEVGMALVSLLTKDDWYGQGLAVYKDGKYECVSDHRITGDGEFADLKVAVLANYSCESAGDGTAYYLSRLPNVTVMGMTDPVGCGQETGGNIMLTDDLVQILYPRGLCLNEDGEPNIDTRADRVSRNPVGVRIPLDMDAAMRIFRDRKDYELEYALQYLKEQ